MMTNDDAHVLLRTVLRGLNELSANDPELRLTLSVIGQLCSDCLADRRRVPRAGTGKDTQRYYSRRHNAAADEAVEMLDGGFLPMLLGDRIAASVCSYVKVLMDGTKQQRRRARQMISIVAKGECDDMVIYAGGE